MNPLPALFIFLADSNRAQQCAQLLAPLANSINTPATTAQLLHTAPLPPNALLLLDGALPALDSQQLLSALKGPLLPPPFIAILPQPDETRAAQLIELGAEAVVVHNCLFELLLPLCVKQAINHQLHIQRLKEQQRQELRTLTAGLVHDIRNPLNGISAIMEALLTECGERVDLSDYQHHLRSQLNRLSSLLQDIQTLGSCLDSESLQPLDLVQLCRHSAGQWQRAQPPHTSSPLTLQLPTTPLMVSADPDQLQRALLNLLDNAARHSPPANSITLALQPLGQNWAEIMVIDKGQGIPEPQLARIMEPFFTTHKGSSGLGLPIANAIVTMVGGSLEIHNNSPAPGVCATIRLPRASSTP